MAQNEKILVIRFSSLGDILLTFRAIEQIKLNTNTEVHFLTKEKFKEVVGQNKKAKVVLSISNHASWAELYQFAGQAVIEDYSAIFDLHRNLRTFLFKLFYKLQKGKALFLKIKKYRFKEAFLFLFRRKIFRAFFDHDVLDRRDEALRVIERWSGVKAARNFDADVVSVGLSDSLMNPLKVLNKKVVSINHESLWKEKEWSFAKFTEVMRLLLNEDYSVVLTGLKRVDLADAPGFLNLTGKTNLEQLLSVYRNSDVVICNDSGAMHLAEAVGRPVVAIFGPTSSEVGFAPRNSKSRIVESSLWCRPCSKNGKACFRIKNKQLCLTQVTVEQVFSAAKAVLMNEREPT